MKSLTKFQLLAENGRFVYEIYTWNSDSFKPYTTIRCSSLLAKESEGEWAPTDFPDPPSRSQNQGTNKINFVFMAFGF